MYEGGVVLKGECLLESGGQFSLRRLDASTSVPRRESECFSGVIGFPAGGGTLTMLGRKRSHRSGTSNLCVGSVYVIRA